MTDEMIKKMCVLERPMDMRSIGILNPARNKEGYKPKYITDKKMEGIKYTELPTYAPANVRGLIGAIKNNSKVAEPIIEKYLETSINREIQKYGGEETKEELEDEVIFEEFEVQQDGDSVSIVELEDMETQTPELGAGRPPIKSKEGGQEIKIGKFQPSMTDEERDAVESGVSAGEGKITGRMDAQFNQEKKQKGNNYIIKSYPSLRGAAEEL